MAKAAAVLSIVDKGIDVFVKLRESFMISPKTEQEARKCKEELSKLEFDQFDETSSCKSVRGIPEEKFGALVARLQKRFDFPDKVKESMLDGLYAEENKESVKEFRFKDDKGTVYHGRFVTLKKGEKMDLAYAVYSLSFTLSKKYIKTAKQNYWLYIIPADVEVSITEEPQKLSDREMDKFTKWCTVKLYHRVLEESGDGSDGNEVAVA